MNNHLNLFSFHLVPRATLTTRIDERNQVSSACISITNATAGSNQVVSGSITAAKTTLSSTQGSRHNVTTMSNPSADVTINGTLTSGPQGSLTTSTAGQSLISPTITPGLSI
jgi:hypothetical protein